MKSIRLMIKMLVVSLICLACASLAQAQATRTWVSGVGDDANPCSRTAPCKTFAGAISKTAHGGEISVLDPGGFGAVTITHGLTIDGNGVVASILASGTPGIRINAGNSDTVILRNLAINGIGGTSFGGTDGIVISNAGRVMVDNCSISGFLGNSINVNTVTDISVTVTNTNITGTAGTSMGILVQSTAGRVTVAADHVTIRNTHNGIHARFGSTLLSNSLIANTTGVGLLAEIAGTLTAESVMLTGNNTAVQANAGGIMRVWNNAIYDNLTAFGCGAGTVATGGNNR